MVHRPRPRSRNQWVGVQYKFQLVLMLWGPPWRTSVLEQWLSGLTAHGRPLGSFKNTNGWLWSSENVTELVWAIAGALGFFFKALE